MKISLVSVFLFLTWMSFAQTENVFLNRSYWKSKPSIEQITRDIESGNDPAAFNEHTFNAITWAIIEDVPNETALFLLDQKGNEVNKRAHDGRSPIFWAAYRGNVELMKQLIERGAKLDLIDDHGNSVVNFAASTGQLNPKLYDICIENGVKLNDERTKEGATPLLLIMPYLNSPELITYFTDKGLSLDQLDKAGNNAFVYAARSGNMQMMKLCLEKGLDPRTNNDAALIFAGKGGRGIKNSVEVFTFLTSIGLSIQAKDEEGKTALHHLASRSQDKEVLAFFIQSSDDLTATDENGDSPFLLAISNNDVEIIRFLAERIKDKYIVNGEGENALHLAVKRNDTKVLAEVLTYGLDINARRSDSLTPLHIAAMKAKDDQLLKQLILAGADKSLLTEFEESAFDLASENEALQSQDISITFLK